MFSWDCNLFLNELIITGNFFYQSCMHTFFPVTYGIEMKSPLCYEVFLALAMKMTLAGKYRYI